MLHLILIIMVQSGLNVAPVNIRIEGPFTQTDCHVLQLKESSKILELQPGNDARWQIARCVQIISQPEGEALAPNWRYY